MEYIQLTQENLQKEHICCSMTEKKGDHSVTDKKAWLKERMEEGLVFYKADVRGKVFIEYIPAQAAWFPIQTDNWMHINCLWVSGSFKGCGYSDELLEHCIADAKAKGMHGLTILSGKKKRALRMVYCDRSIRKTPLYCIIPINVRLPVSMRSNSRNG